MIFLWQLENIRTPFFNEIMQFVTYFGQELLIIAVICALYWCADKRFAYYLGFTYFTAGFCVQALKITFRIPRPWILDPEFKAVKSAILPKRTYSRGYMSLLPVSSPCQKSMGKNTVYTRIFMCWFFQNVSRMSHTKGCFRIYGSVHYHCIRFLAFPFKT